ncbi:MAG: hypothetical protein EZS28_032948 [Streblomastix strix]|uniref:Uncharacterized protein n=2 Tax=Streblomastix strix TaxID=222440 RepID=A0A5J4ULK1_9EUKA|nr:MAG: hypothetical protein EZS28_032948 [Streblomastix strix]
MRTSAVQAENSSWMIYSSTWKGENGGDFCIFTNACMNIRFQSFDCPSGQTNAEVDYFRTIFGISQEFISLLPQIFGPKTVHEIMKLASTDLTYIFISIRSLSIIKLIAIGATRQQVNRFTRHKKGPATMARFYVKNINDELRERLATFKRRGLANKKVNS